MYKNDMIYKISYNNCSRLNQNPANMYSHVTCWQYQMIPNIYCSLETFFHVRTILLCEKV